MCQSQAAGGKRCASHTRPRFEAATPGTPEWDDAAADYARTKKGRETITQVMSDAVAARHFDLAVAAQAAIATADRAEVVQAEFNRQLDTAVRNAYTTEDADKLRQWSTNDHPKIVQAVAANRHTPDDVLTRLAADGSVDVRATIAARAKAPAAVFEQLARDPKPKVRYALQSYVTRPLSVINGWADSDDSTDRIRGAYAAKIGNHSEVLSRLANDPEFAVRSYVAQAPATPVEDLRRLTGDRDLSIAALAMRNASLPDDDFAAAVHARAEELAADRYGPRRDLAPRIESMGRPDLFALINPPTPTG